MFVDLLTSSVVGGGKIKRKKLMFMHACPCVYSKWSMIKIW